MEHHGVEDLWPDSIKPHPEQPVGGEEPRAARALPTQNNHLVSQSNEFKFQRCAAAHPEREQGTDSGQKCDHADDGMGSAQETLHLVGGFDFCAGTPEEYAIDIGITTSETSARIEIRKAVARLAPQRADSSTQRARGIPKHACANDH